MAIYKGQLTKEASNYLTEHNQQVELDLSTPIKTLKQFKRWVLNNFTEYLSTKKRWE